MKAKYLMIGDWVAVRRPGDRHEQVRVKSVIGNGTIEAKTSDGLVAIGELAVEPIPLTGEMLEKNFEKKTLYGIFDDYFDFEIREFNDSMYIVNYHSCEMPIPDTQISNICFVHELQHALRLCGVEKEINL